MSPLEIQCKKKKKNIRGKIRHYDIVAAKEACLASGWKLWNRISISEDAYTDWNASRSHGENVLSVSTPARLLFYICRMFFWLVAAWGLALRAALMPDCFVRHLPVKANTKKGISSRSANAPPCEMMTFSFAGLILPDNRICIFTIWAQFSAPSMTKIPHLWKLEVKHVTPAGLNSSFSKFSFTSGSEQAEVNRCQWMSPACNWHMAHMLSSLSVR